MEHLNVFCSMTFLTVVTVSHAVPRKWAERERDVWGHAVVLLQGAGQTGQES